MVQLEAAVFSMQTIKIKRITKVIAISLLIVLTFTPLKDEYSRYLLSNANYGMQVIINNNSISSSNSANPNSGITLYNGSSMFRQGIDINEAITKCGTNTYVLSYNGNQPFLEYYEIKYLLDNNVKIEHLYLDMYVFAMQSDPWIHDNKIFLDTDLSFKIQVWNRLNTYGKTDFNNFWEMFVTSGNDELLTWPISYPMVNHRFYNGGNTTETSSAEKKYLDSSSTSILTSQAFNSEQVTYLEMMIHLCNKNKIDLTFIETPKYTTIGNNVNYIELMKRYSKILDKYKTKYIINSSTASACYDFSSAQHIIEFDNKNPDYYIDNIHLSSNGRREFTKKLLAFQFFSKDKN